ncbi:hypothetical protein EV715DRAFT_250828 [Schizophyllum commune]
MFARIFTIVSVAMLVAAQPHGRGLPVLGGILGGGGGGGGGATVTVTVPGECPTVTQTVTVTGSGTWGVPTSSSTWGAPSSSSTSRTSTPARRRRALSPPGAPLGLPPGHPRPRTPPPRRRRRPRAATTRPPGAQARPARRQQPGVLALARCRRRPRHPRTLEALPGRASPQSPLTRVMAVASATRARSSAATGLDLDSLVGVQCSPLSVIGVGGNSCSSQVACCSNNTYNGLINIGCVPINISL